MSLLAMQRDFRAWLWAEDDAIAVRIDSGSRPGLQVYQNNYRAQLVACLEESFAQTRAWIGGERFHEAVVAYVEGSPPSSWTLDAYGRDFPAMLAALHRDDPEIAELAWIEHALGEAFVGPDAPAIKAADVADVDWDRALLRFVPTLDQRDLVTNAPVIWSALAAGTCPPAVEILAEPAAVLTWREDEMPRFRTIDRQECHALLLARGGLRFADLCAAIVERHGERDGIMLAGTFLGRWLGDGLICAIT